VSVGNILAIALAASAPLPGNTPAGAPPPLATTPATPPDSGPTKPADTAVSSYPPGFFASVTPNTALDMVNNLPGFALDTGDTVRGFGGAAGNVLIDGERPATKNDTLDEILKRIPASEVARIDVIRGGAPGIDMQGKTVIANVVRKDDSGLKLTTALQGIVLNNGVLDYGVRLEGSKRVGQTSFEGGLLLGKGADDGTGDGPRTITDGSGHVIQTAYERSFGNGGEYKATGAVETPLWGGRVRVEGSFLAQPYVYDNHDTLIAPPGLETEHYTQDQDTGEIGIRYERPLTAKASLETYALQQLGTYASNDLFDTASDDTVFTLTKHTGESIVRGVLKLNPNPSLSLEGGAEGDFNYLISNTGETDNGLAEVVPAADVLVEELRGEAFADATWRARPKLTLELGVRVEASKLTSTGDVNATETFMFPKPHLVVTWTPDANDQVRVRIEREVGQLDFNNFAAQGTLGTGEHAGNPTLTPQQDWVVEAAYDRKFWQSADLNIALRQYWLTDVIDYAPQCPDGDLSPGGLCDPDAVFDAPANIGVGTKQEIAFTLSLPTDRLLFPNGVLQLRSTWRFSRVTDPDTGQPRPISNLHPLDAEAHFTQGLKRLKSTWGWDAFPAWTQTNYYVNEVDVQRLGFWLDAYFEYKPRPDFTLRFEADNLTSHGVSDVRSFYDPLRDTPGGGMLSSVDARYPRFGPELSIRARKTFG
jgi:hypothetical protein